MDKLLTNMNNVFVRFPEIGDVVVKDIETKTPHYIKLDSFIKTELDESVYEIIGAVAWREHDKVLVVYKENTSTQYMNRPWWYLSGYTLDGTDRTGTLSIRVPDDNWNANVEKVIPYNATSAEELVEQLNGFFEGDADCNAQDWYANIEEDGSVRIHCDGTKAWQVFSYTTAESGFALTLCAPEIDMDYIIRRKNGNNDGYGSIFSMQRAIEAFTPDLSYETHNPSTDVKPMDVVRPITLPAYLGESQYQSDHCKALRERYGEGKDGWLKFLESLRPVAPCDYGTMRKRNGKERTDFMAQKMFTSRIVSEPKAMCNAAYYCSNVNSKTVDKGEFWLPTADELSYIFKTIEYGTDSSWNSDPINRCLNKIGNNTISNKSSWWSCCRYRVDNAWCLSGSWGFLNNNYMRNAPRVLPVSLYTVR